MSVSDQIRSEIESFASKMTALVRQEALNAAMSALGGPASAPRVRVEVEAPGEYRRPAVTRQRAATVNKRAVTGKSGQKRDPEALAALVKAAGGYILAHPGQGVEQIGAALKYATAELALPIRKLLAAKVITRKGQKRATKYFPAAAKAAPKAKAAATKKAPKAKASKAVANGKAATPPSEPAAE